MLTQIEQIRNIFWCTSPVLSTEKSGGRVENVPAPESEVAPFWGWYMICAALAGWTAVGLAVLAIAAVLAGDPR